MDVINVILIINPKFHGRAGVFNKVKKKGGLGREPGNHSKKQLPGINVATPVPSATISSQLPPACRGDVEREDPEQCHVRARSGLSASLL